MVSVKHRDYLRWPSQKSLCGCCAGFIKQREMEMKDQILKKLKDIEQRYGVRVL